MCVVTNETIEEDEDEDDDVTIEKGMRASIPENSQRDDKKPESASHIRSDFEMKKIAK